MFQIQMDYVDSIQIDVNCHSYFLFCMYALNFPNQIEVLDAFVWVSCACLCIELYMCSCQAAQSVVKHALEVIVKWKCRYSNSTIRNHNKFI